MYIKNRGRVTFLSVLWWDKYVSGSIQLCLSEPVACLWPLLPELSPPVSSVPEPVGSEKTGSEHQQDQQAGQLQWAVQTRTWYCNGIIRLLD